MSIYVLVCLNNLQIDYPFNQDSGLCERIRDEGGEGGSTATPETAGHWEEVVDPTQGSVPQAKTHQKGETVFLKTDKENISLC